jgi:hypothetical protein
VFVRCILLVFWFVSFTAPLVRAALILSTNDGAVQMSDLVGAIMLRCTNANWNVVLKTLMLTHRLLRDGNVRFMDELKFRPKVFDLDHFNDVATPDGSSEFPIRSLYRFAFVFYVAIARVQTEHSR